MFNLLNFTLRNVIFQDCHDPSHKMSYKVISNQVIILSLLITSFFSYRYNDGYVSENVEVILPKDSIPPSFSICPSHEGSYKSSYLLVSQIKIKLQLLLNFHLIAVSGIEFVKR